MKEVPKITEAVSLDLTCVNCGAALNPETEDCDEPDCISNLFDLDAMLLPDEGGTP